MMMPRWMKTAILALGGIALGSYAAGARADDTASETGVTFYKDILPILQSNCQNCHRQAGQNLSGMIAPMGLMSYEEVRPWAKSIAKVVKERQMPPWHATPQFHGIFRNERTLTEEQISTLVKWVQNGSPAGRAEEAPAPKVFTSVDGWTIGKPDLIVTPEKPYFVKDDVWDQYQNIPIKLTEAQLPEDRYIKALEFRPGNKVVHHIIAFAHAPGDDMAMDRGMIGGMAPGTDPTTLQDGYGLLLKKGSTVIFQMHYHKEKGAGTGVEERSEMALKFYDKPVAHAVHIEPISNGRFEIPPFTSNWKVGMGRTFDRDIIITSLLPHTHLRGTAAKYVAFYPDGKEETLLEVPSYDFNWQTDYMFKEPKRIPAGTRIEATMVYDNSAERQKRAPEVDPTRAVRFGGPTTDEMDLAWMTYTETEPIKTPAAVASGAGQ